MKNKNYILLFPFIATILIFWLFMEFRTDYGFYFLQTLFTPFILLPILISAILGAAHSFDNFIGFTTLLIEMYLLFYVIKGIYNIIVKLLTKLKN
jgi:uncharacterized membrane protein